MQPTKLELVLIDDLMKPEQYWRLPVSIEALDQMSEPDAKNLLWDCFLLSYRNATGKRWKD